MKRYCIGCVHCWIDLGDAGYSEMTPGYPGSIRCTKGHYDYGAREDPDVEQVMRQARDCPDFKERET